MEHSAALTTPAGYTDDIEVTVDHHPAPAQYLWVAAILAVITGLEVATYYVDLTGGVLVATLVALATIKFSLVAAYFMHLKFDSRFLRRFFLTGLVLALFVFSAGLFTMDMLFH